MVMESGWDWEAGRLFWAEQQRKGCWGLAMPMWRGGLISPLLPPFAGYKENEVYKSYIYGKQRVCLFHREEETGMYCPDSPVFRGYSRRRTEEDIEGSRRRTQGTLRNDCCRGGRRREKL